MPLHNPPEDGFHGRVVKFIDGDGVKMPQETRSDDVTTSTWCEKYWMVINKNSNWAITKLPPSYSTMHNFNISFWCHAEYITSFSISELQFQNLNLSFKYLLLECAGFMFLLIIIVKSNIVPEFTILFALNTNNLIAQNVFGGVYTLHRQILLGCILESGLTLILD